ncbi:MAG: hypothetical protein RIQ56_285, partial [Candidatus Parcubacteria bacterium]
MPLSVRRPFASLIFLGLLLCTHHVSAQQLQSRAEEVRLQKYYDQQIANPDKPNPALEKRIADERVRIRATFDAEIGRLVQAISSTGSGETLDPASAAERQRAIVTTLQARLDEVNVDLDLLREEERRYYLESSPVTATGALEEGRITESYAELLAKRAVLEERAAAIQSALTLQQDRLQKLSVRQRFEQFSVAFAALWYILIVAVVVGLERFLRLTFLAKISDRNRRYFLMKLFTAVTYILLAIWLLVRLFEEYPGIATSFAIIGAGIAVSLQDILKDFVGWLIILHKGMFTLGQRVTIGGITGDVIDIGPLRMTLLEVSNMAYPGESARNAKPVFVPNSLVLR